MLIGPHSHVNGATVEDEVFVATGASLFPGAMLPIGWIAAGNPATLFSPDRHDELWELQRTLEFPQVVYGVPRGTTMRGIMSRQARFYGAHQDDRILEDRPDDDA
ncbi:hypothetical protein ACWEOG_03410 [Amycolatopsis japonica]